jgi:hypothetical protein
MGCDPGSSPRDSPRPPSPNDSSVVSLFLPCQSGGGRWGGGFWFAHPTGSVIPSRYCQPCGRCAAFTPMPISTSWPGAERSKLSPVKGSPMRWSPYLMIGWASTSDRAWEPLPASSGGASRFEVVREPATLRSAAAPAWVTGTAKGGFGKVPRASEHSPGVSRGEVAPARISKVAVDRRPKARVRGERTAAGTPVPG